MTMTTFETLCGELLIDPSLALENDSIRDALASRDDARVKEILETEY